MTRRVAVNTPALPREAAGASAPAPGLPARRPLETLLRRAVRRVLEARRVAEAEISLTLLDDDAMRELNRDWLGHDRPTDVIAFPLHEENAPPLGDVYVGIDRALAQADELGVEPREELVRLAVHGTLHVLGLDHDEGAAREQGEMWRIQEELVRGILEERA